MRHALSVIILITFVSLILIQGCDLARNVLPKRCPSTCDDQTACSLDICNKDTNYLCVHQSIVPCDGNKICENGEYLNSTDCPNCDDKNSCTLDKMDYTKGECSYEFLSSCCGNQICDATETGSSCPSDCPSCDDSYSCTIDNYNRIDKKCEHKYIFPCCGNGRCELGEKYATCQKDCQPSQQDEIIICGTNQTCLTDVALKYKEAEICKNAATFTGTDECFEKLAVDLNKSYYCTMITNTKRLSHCQEAYAISQLAVEMCPFDNPNTCIESIAEKTKNAELCNRLTEQFVRTKNDFILKCKAIVLSNFLLCKQLENIWVADKCFTQLAVQLKDASLCDAVDLDKDTCRFAVEDAILFSDNN